MPALMIETGVIRRPRDPVPDSCSIDPIVRSILQANTMTSKCSQAIAVDSFSPSIKVSLLEKLAKKMLVFWHRGRRRHRLQVHTVNCVIEKRRVGAVVVEVN
jgi:hypothetical protein